jgi:DNA-binding HxlR family transcriptional regulator
MIVAAVERQTGPFRVADIQRQCPGVSLDMIRRLLKAMRTDGQVRCLGRGQNATWERGVQK